MIPDDVEFSQLDRAARARLRPLTKDNAYGVGRHLVTAGRLLDTDPESAYLHAQEAVRRAGRIDVVREAAALTAYATGRYAEALREFRTVRRLNGSSEHLPLMADCERGLGRPERALSLAASPEAEELDAAGRVELALVVSGARADLGEREAALAVVADLRTAGLDAALVTRVVQVRAEALRACGRGQEADALLASAGLPLSDEPEDEPLIVVDLEESALEESTLEESAPAVSRSVEHGAAGQGFEDRSASERGADDHGLEEQGVDAHSRAEHRRDDDGHTVEQPGAGPVGDGTRDESSQDGETR